MCDINDFAPDFTLPGLDGTSITLSELRGAPVVLFFYPRDNTPGCTKEAIGFTAALAQFAETGTRVFGISKDSLRKHENFRTKQDLGINLLSDAEGDVCERFGVWKEKKMYGKTHMGIERSTFLIDAEGRIAQIWRKVKVDGHVEAVLAEARAL